MKFNLLFLSMILFTGCMVKEESHTASSQVSSVSSLGSSSGVMYQEALVQVDTDSQKIVVDRGFITGPAKMVSNDGGTSEFQCGISIQDDSELTYELISPSALQLTINDKVLELNRIHASADDSDIFGDWVSHEVGKNYSKRWTFSIQENGIMNVDFACSNVFE